MSGKGVDLGIGLRDCILYAPPTGCVKALDILESHLLTCVIPWKPVFPLVVNCNSPQS